MSQTTDNETAYGPDQDREPPKVRENTWQQSADRNPDDFDIDLEEGMDISAASRAETGVSTTRP